MARRPERGSRRLPSDQARTDRTFRAVRDERRLEFGQQLRAFRIARSWTQADLAEATGLHRSYVGGVERGERNVTLDNMWALADGLDLSPAEFFIPGSIE